MMSKISFAVFAILLKTITAQSITRYNAGLYGNRGVNQLIEPYSPYSPMPNLAYNGIYGPSPMAYDSQGLCLESLSASNVGGFTVTSSSPISPNGIFLQSENMVMEGPLVVNGQIPFLGTIAVEGSLSALGNGAVMYECGNGNVGILNEEYSNVAPSNIVSRYMGPGLTGPGMAGPGMTGPFGYNIFPGVNRVA